MRIYSVQVEHSSSIEWYGAQSIKFLSITAEAFIWDYFPVSSAVEKCLGFLRFLLVVTDTFMKLMKDSSDNYYWGYPKDYEIPKSRSEVHNFGINGLTIFYLLLKGSPSFRTNFCWSLEKRRAGSKRLVSKCHLWLHGNRARTQCYRRYRRMLWDISTRWDLNQISPEESFEEPEPRLKLEQLQ